MVTFIPPQDRASWQQLTQLARAPGLSLRELLAQRLRLGSNLAATLISLALLGLLVAPIAAASVWEEVLLLMVSLQVERKTECLACELLNAEVFIQHAHLGG